MADFIVIVILGIIVFFIIRGQLSRTGQAQNGGGCSGCSGCSSCSACGGHSTCASAAGKKTEKVSRGKDRKKSKKVSSFVQT